MGLRRKLRRKRWFVKQFDGPNFNRMFIKSEHREFGQKRYPLMFHDRYTLHPESVAYLLHG